MNSKDERKLRTNDAEDEEGEKGAYYVQTIGYC
jgi:hypothetical protein